MYPRGSTATMLRGATMATTTSDREAETTVISVMETAEETATSTASVSLVKRLSRRPACDKKGEGGVESGEWEGGRQRRLRRRPPRCAHRGAAW
jgi:hypothetical protein